jgi:anti-sigma factor RsiW
MDCREFHNKHFAFVDDTLSGIELVGVQRHIAECEDCAKHDAMVRRSLLLFRNLPRIEPSAAFAERLNVRLRELKETETSPVFEHSRKIAATVAITSLVMLGYIGSSLRDVDSPRDIVFPPVVASLPETETFPIATPALVASVPAGLPIWTAALYAELAPIHFASADLQLTSARR